MINYSLIGSSESVHEVNVNKGWWATRNIHKTY